MIESPSDKLTGYLDDVVRNAIDVDKSEFIRLSYANGDGKQKEAFVHPLQLKKKPTRNYFHGNLASLLYVAKGLSEAKGLKLELPNTHAIKGIVVSPENRIFRESNPGFSLISDLLIVAKMDGYEIRKVEDVSFDDIILDYGMSDEAVVEQRKFFKTEKFREGNVLGTRFFAPRVLSRETPLWVVGCFKDFEGPIPRNLFRGGERDGVWQGYRDDVNGLSCVKGKDGSPIAPLSLSAEPCKTTKARFVYYTEENPHK